MTKTISLATWRLQTFSSRFRCRSINKLNLTLPNLIKPYHPHHTLAFNARSPTKLVDELKLMFDAVRVRLGFVSYSEHNNNKWKNAQHCSHRSFCELRGVQETHDAIGKATDSGTLLRLLSSYLEYLYINTCLWIFYAYVLSRLQLTMLAGNSKMRSKPPLNYSMNLQTWHTCPQELTTRPLPAERPR